ncbi:hypothetical protein BDV19DRAFT_377328 [Aspergillus venezuelensis]
MTEKQFLNGWVGKTIQFTKNDQIMAVAFHKPGPLQGKPGCAHCTFLCHNADDSSDIKCPGAIRGYCSAPERARQATTSLTPNGLRELEPLQKLTQNDCKSAPHIREHESGLQDDDGSRELNKDVFWSLSDEERSNVRDAFRLAWLECVRADKRSPTVTIVGFRDSRSAKSDDAWRHIEWIM